MNIANQTILAPDQRSRYVLMAVIALHVLAVCYWAKQRITRDAAPPVRFTEVFSPRLSAGPSAPPAPSSPSPGRPRGIRVPRLVDPVPAITLVALAPAPTPADPAPLVKFTDQVMEQARREVGKIDRELRKGSLNMAERDLVLRPSRRASLLGGAYIGQDADRTEETTLADGRLMSKVIRGGKSFCATKEHNGLVGARDVFRDGVRTEIKSCPQ